MNKINTREPVCVDFGVFKLYCDSFKLTSKTDLTEIPSVSSSTVLSKKTHHSTHIFIAGRICNKKNPMFIAGVLNNMQNSSGISIIYRDLRFTGCTMCGYTAEDCGGDFVNVSVELATLAGVQFLEEESL